jgi:hypothetical protein
MRTLTGTFSASDTSDVGLELDSPVWLDSFGRVPFPFSGKI